MDFITYEPNTAGYWLLGFAVLGFALIFSGLIIFEQVSIVLLGAVLLIGGLIGGVLTPSGVEDWSKDARAEIKDTYGVTLSEKQFEKLKYPERKEEPEGDFAQYGSVTVVKPDGDRGFEKTEVYLLWSHGEMVLASPDEQKKLQPLKARD